MVPEESKTVRVRKDTHKALKLWALQNDMDLNDAADLAVTQFLGGPSGDVAAKVPEPTVRVVAPPFKAPPRIELPEEDEPEVAAPVRHEVKLRGAWNGYDEVTGEEYALPIFWVDGRWTDSKDTELPYQVADQLARLLRTKKISLEGLE